MTVVLIVNGRVHQILRNQTEIPKWPPFANSDVPLLVKAPDDVQIGDFYNAETGEFTSSVDPKQQAIQEIKHQLEVIDAESGASRNVRDVCVATGFLIQTLQELNGWMFEELGITMPEDFGKDANTIFEIMALKPPENASPEEIKMFERYKTLKKFGRFQPEYNEGLMRIIKAEQKAVELRRKLAELQEG